MTTLLAIPSDVHSNSIVGVLPQRISLETGIHLSNETQGWIAECWADSWQRILDLKHQYQARLITISNGEAVDSNKHTRTELLTKNEADIIKIATKVWEFPRSISDVFVVVRGTEAHTGEGAALEEIFASKMDAEPSPLGTHSWWYFLAEIEGLLLDFAHHARTYGYRPWTRDAAASRQSEITFFRKSRLGRQVPDISVRSHGHYPADSGSYTKPRTFYTRPWQLTTAFGHRLGTADELESLGTLVLALDNGNMHPVDIHYPPPETPVWQPEWKEDK